MDTCLILDCCQNQPGRGIDAFLSREDDDLMTTCARDIQAAVRPQQTMRRLPATILVSSCSADQCAYEWQNEGHSIFTYFFLPEMKNHRDRGIASMISRIRNSVCDKAHELYRQEQHPFIKLEGSGDIFFPTGEIIPNPSDFKIQGDVLKKYVGNSDIVKIPENIRVIAGCCFHYARIKKIIIPAKVEFIGDDPGMNIYTNYENGAFESCDELETVVFEENSQLRSIGLYAFYGCRNLKSIIGLPKGIRTVKSYSFGKCTQLSENSKESIKMNTIPGGLTDNWNKDK